MPSSPDLFVFDLVVSSVCVYRNASIVVAAVQGSGRLALVSSAHVAGVPPPFT